MNIKFTNMTESLWRERMESVMEYERSVITITLLRLDYRVHGPGNYADDTLTQTDPVPKT